ncbi:urease accessory protein [Breoghania corrubedonensis]|uniref:Urease accessory protein UreE n=1 Tax=Breoghania corrubedonensis TaxID=665038 RepID=A0A2T5VID9_9HYPH|nr:urease accessory protein UreE [Breoghania corrubedonensis]PTW63527.1 urease accessory protein [Breoghania corrubedonensis]
MIRALGVLEAGTWVGEPADRVELDHDDRHRRRMAMTGEGGCEFLLDLPKAVALRSGDALELEDGRLVEVVSAPEALVEIAADDMGHLVQIAWHLGNRHLPTQLLGDRLRIRRDHVIEEMVEKLGGGIMPVSAPFDPEGGAYGHGAVHGHDHGSDDCHDHDHHPHGSHDHV